jgi:AraC-like DNA-binding protein
MPQPEGETRLEWMRSAALSGVEFLACENDRTPWHVFHERYVLCSTEHSSALCLYRGKLEQLSDGSTMLMEPGESHRNLTVPRPQNFRVVFFEPHLFIDAAKEHGMPATPHFRGFRVADPRLLQALYRLSHSIELQDTALEQQSRLAVYLRLVLTYAEQHLRSAGPGYAHSAVLRAQAYLQERFNEPVTLDELSAFTGLSPYHLVRSFTRQIGVPPHAYQNHVRVERARALLTAGVSPAEIAVQIGFADQSHFTRHFRRIMNITPSAYARATR